MLVRICRNWNHYTLWRECKDADLWKSLAVPQKAKQNYHMIQQLHSYIHKKWKHIQTNTCTWVFISAPIQTAKRWKLPKCSSMNEWKKYIHKNYSALKRNEVLIHNRTLYEPWKHYAKWKKPDTTDHIFYEYTSMIFVAVVELLSCV